jgi:2',3'-cyclic-nucleotide 2'-phosphodiesterase (5'-nucleotidase family)
MKPILFLFIFLVVACSPKTYQIQDVHTEVLDVEDGQIQSGDSDTLEHLIQPYKDSVDLEMSRVIGKLLKTLYRGKPEGSLGNFVADVMKEEYEEAKGLTIDLACTNSGGLRIPLLDSGQITVGEIYELMPFDNTLVECMVSGEELMIFIEHMVEQGGWPVSRGIQIVAEGEQITALIQGKRIEPKRRYRVLVNNYIAGGGSGCDFMNSWMKEDSGILLRDVIIEHIREETENGESFFAEMESRIIIFNN